MVGGGGMEEACGGEGRKRGQVSDGGEPAAEAKRRMAHPASRIYRVSRASGGKDRHSKVYTAKGIRDRRVRLSVATAIQFYDLQDRLGYDQPSKAVEWLIKAAETAIDKLPSLDTAAGFPSHPASAAAANKDLPPPAGANPQGSGCSSTSETSKGSVLSLSRSETRVVKTKERRAAAASTRDKEQPGGEDAATARRQPATASSFAELLSGLAAVAERKPWTPATADYIGFKAGHGTPHTFASPAPHLGTNVGVAPAQQHFGFPAGAVTVASGGGETQFSFLQDLHAAPVSSGPAGDYTLNFSMSSGLVGVTSRGTLQSNSQPYIISGGHHHQQQQLQRLSTPLALDAPNIPFLFSPAAAVTTPTAVDTQIAAFQLWNGFHHHADIKEKGKN